MEQTNFSIRKRFEEIGKLSRHPDGVIILYTPEQEEICKQVDAQEKKYAETIDFLRGIIEDFQSNAREGNTHDVVLIIDTLQRVVGALSVTGDTIARDKDVAKMMEYIEQL